MSQPTSSLQYTALLLGLLIVGGFIYWYGSGLYKFTHVIVPVGGSTSTVTISAEKLAELEMLAEEYRVLVNETTFSSATTTSPEQDQQVSARVIGRPPQSPYDTLVLDAGTADGVILGAGVRWPPGVYLGEVKEVDSRHSVVELVSAPGVRHSATLSGIPVTTVGRGGDSLYVEIPDNEDVSVGMAVISDVYNLPLGVVAAVEQLPTTNLQAVYITRFISSAVIESVHVERQ